MSTRRSYSAQYLADFARLVVAGADGVVLSTERLDRKYERAVAAVLTASHHHRQRVGRCARHHFRAEHAYDVVWAVTGTRHLSKWGVTDA